MECLISDTLTHYSRDSERSSEPTLSLNMLLIIYLKQVVHEVGSIGMLVPSFISVAFKSADAQECDKSIMT